ncbi:MAG: DUF6056 family protein [Cycloclasticus sp.]
MFQNKYLSDDRTFSFNYSMNEAFFWTIVVISVMGYLLFSLPAMPYSHDWEYTVKLNEQGFWLFITEHYTLVNGRVFAHLLIAIFGKYYSLWLIINAIVIMLFPLIMLSTIRKGNDRFKLTDAIIFLAWMGFLANCTFHFYQIGFFWMTGSLNYIWPTLMLLIVYKVYWGRLVGFRQWSTLKFNLILAFVFFSSITHELPALVVLGLLITKLLFIRWKTGVLYSRLGWSVFISLVGFVLLISAPGNFVRLDEAGVSITSLARTNAAYITSYFISAHTHQVLISALLVVMGLFSFITAATSHSLWPKRIAWMLVIILITHLYLMFTFDRLMPIHYLWAVIFVVGQFIFSTMLILVWNKPALSILSFVTICYSLVLLIVPGFGPRILLPGMLLYECLILGILVDILETHRKHIVIIATVATLCLFVIGTSEAMTIHRMYSDNERAWKVIHNKIESWKNEGNKSNNIMLRRLPVPEGHFEMPYLNPYFTEYFYRYFDLPKGILIAWEGKNTDSTQRSVLKDLSNFKDVLEKGKDQPKIKFSKKNWYCQAEYLDRKIIFSYNIWSCGGGQLFNIELLDKNDIIQAYYKGTLSRDELMVTVTGLDGAFSTHHIYSLPAQSNIKNDRRKLRLTWLGTNLVSYY